MTDSGQHNTKKRRTVGQGLRNTRNGLVQSVVWQKIAAKKLADKMRLRVSTQKLV